MKVYVYAYLGAAVCMLILDGLWLSTMVRVFYRPNMGDLMGEFRVAPAVIFYLLYVVGVVYFAISPALQSGNWSVALINGALFGFFAYATYDLTNQATLKGWPTILTVVDMAWGTALTGITGLMGYFAAKYA